MTNAQAIDRWFELRGLQDEDRIEILMADFFRVPVALDCEYEATLRRLSEAMVEEMVR